MTQFGMFLLMTVTCSSAAGFALAYLAKLLIGKTKTESESKDKGSIEAKKAKAQAAHV